MISAIAIDANAFPKGRYDAKALGRWASQARSRSLEIWIAEPVLWELMEHAVADIRALEAALESRAGPLRKAGFAIPTVPKISDPAAEIEAAIRNTPGVVVIPVPGDAAREALKDQILVRTPGEKVEVRSAASSRQHKTRAVKTGASDSAWVRAIHAHAGGESQSYVVVSRDSDVPRTYMALGWDSPLVFPDLYALGHQLHHLRPDEGEVFTAVVRFLDMLSAYDETHDRHEGLRELDRQVLNLGDRFHVPSDVSDALSPSGWESPLSEDERVVRITAPVLVRDVELDPEAQVAYASVTVQGELERTSWVWDDQDDQLVAHQREIEDVLLHAPLTFSLENGEVVAASNDGGDVWVSSQQDRYNEPTEALDAVLETLMVYTERELIGVDLAERGELRVPTVAGPELRITFEGDLWEGEWQASVQIAEASITLSCTFDATSWVGGKDGGFSEPPYILSADEGSHWIASPTGRLAELLLRHAVGS